MDVHRRSKTLCPHITDYCNSCFKDKSFSIQTTETVFGDVHNENGIVDENICRLRLSREDLWMETLRANYYAKNEVFHWGFLQ